jgi:uncharacterized protein YcnI
MFTPATASASVTVTPDVAMAGSWATLTFDVANERDDAATTALELDFPTDTPLRGVSVLPHPGWSYDVARTTPGDTGSPAGPGTPAATATPSRIPNPANHNSDMPGMNMPGMNMPGMNMPGMAGHGGMSRSGPSRDAPQAAAARSVATAGRTDGLSADYVSRITWTASGAGIRPGQFDQFTIGVGPLPAVAGSLTFKALQTYSTGEVARWTGQATPGGPAPDHPAPTLRLVAAAPALSGSVADYAIGMLPAGPNNESGPGNPTQSMPGMKMGSSEQATGGMSMGGMSMGGMSMGGSAADSSDVALATGIGGLFAGLLGLILAVGALRRHRSGEPATGPAASCH